MMTNARRIQDEDYRRLLTVRTGLRQFERWSADQASTHGLRASQHQLLLAIRGHDQPEGPTIGDIADYLLIQHNSAGELIDRTERGGLIARSRDHQDHRMVRLSVTEQGDSLLEALTGAHLEELRRLRPLFETLLEALS